MTYLRSKDISDARASVKIVLRASRSNRQYRDRIAAAGCREVSQIPKKELSKTYRKPLSKNMQAVSPIAEHLDQIGPIGSTRINDLADCAAKKLILDETSIISDDSDVWRFNGKHFERVQRPI